MDPGNAIVIQGVSMTFIAAAAAAKEMRARARMDTCNDACMHASLHACMSYPQVSTAT